MSVFSPPYYCIFQCRCMMHNFSLSTVINNLKLFLYLRNNKTVELRLRRVAVSCLRKPTCTENFLALKIAGWMKVFNTVNWEFISASEYFAGLFLSVWRIFVFPEGEYLDLKQIEEELQTQHKNLVTEAAADQCSSTRVLEFSEYPVAGMLLLMITG